MKVTDRRPLLVLGVVLAAFVIVAVVKSQGNHTGHTATSSPSTSTTSQSTSGSSTTTVPVLTGDADWKNGLQQITAIENDVFSHPDPNRVDEFMLASCRSYTIDKDHLTGMASRNEHVDGPNITVSNPSLAKQDAPNQVELFVTVTTEGKGVVDDKGTVVEAPLPIQPGPWVYTLQKGNDNHWRVYDRSAIQTEAAP